MSLEKTNEIRHISDIVGEWGKWQRDLTIYVFIVIAISAYTDLSYSFQSYEVDFWCKDLPIDRKNESTEYQCIKYEDPNQLCDHWTYNTSDFNRTINTEFDLVCERSNYASITQSCYQFGYLLTGIVLSQYADKYGRKPLVWISFVIIILAHMSCALAVNVIQYAIARLVVGLSIYGVAGPMCTSLLESCGPKHRSDIYLIAGFGWVFGYVIIPGIAFWAKDYKLMNWLAIIPIVLILVWFYFIPESPRWLITNGRVDTSEQVLRNILKRNGMSDENFDHKFGELKSYLLRTKSAENSTKTYTLLDLIKTPNLRKYSLIFWFSWTVLGLVYYGFSLNMSDFGGNFYITFLLSGVVELPSALITIVALRYFSRRKTLVLFLTIITLSSLAIIPTTDPTLKVTFALIGKFGVGSLWWTYEVYVPEVYPTVLRNTGSGVASSFARLGSMASPFMKNLAANTSLTVVMILYSILSTFAAILAVFLPETHGTEIPDTLDEVEKENKLQIN